MENCLCEHSLESSRSPYQTSSFWRQTMEICGHDLTSCCAQPPHGGLSLCAEPPLFLLIDCWVDFTTPTVDLCWLPPVFMFLFGIFFFYVIVVNYFSVNRGLMNCALIEGSVSGCLLDAQRLSVSRATVTCWPRGLVLLCLCARVIYYSIVFSCEYTRFS
jgi:hypothetical protein